jgi:hypothetical protein
VQMDLAGPGGLIAQVGKLVIAAGYTGTITLKNDLRVDAITMDEWDAKLVGDPAPKILWINQDTNVVGVTFFESSSLAKGTFQNVNLNLSGEMQHPATLYLSSQGNTFKFDSDSFRIRDSNSTVEWRRGDVRVRGTTKIDNTGTFNADSDGTIDLLPGQGGTWEFINWFRLNTGTGKFLNSKYIKRGNQAVHKQEASALGPSQFEILGQYVMLDAGGSTEIESGILLVSGTFTQNGGDTSTDSGTTLHVTGAYAMNGGTLTIAQSSDVTADSGLTMTAGTVEDYGNLNVTGQLLEQGGSIYMEGVILATGGMQINGVALLEGEGTVYADVTNAGIVRPTSRSEPENIGYLIIGGNYNQTGILEYQTDGSPAMGSNLSIYGTASLGGTLLITFLDGFVPQAGTQFISIAWWEYGGGTFNIVGDLPPGLEWQATYHDPANYLDLLVVEEE